VNWLNASLNGVPLDRPGLMKIREFTLPTAGTLRLDYASYQRPEATATPASQMQVVGLLQSLRAGNSAHMSELLALRKATEAPPPPPPHARATSMTARPRLPS
jgi:hypothetical protein